MVIHTALKDKERYIPRLLHTTSAHITDVYASLMDKWCKLPWKLLN